MERDVRKRAELRQPGSGTKCPLTAAMHAIGGRWSLICLYWLSGGPRRFNELRRLMPGISHKMLATTLRNLEHEGLISRSVFAEVPPRVEYELTTHGKSVRPIVETMRMWGNEHLRRRELEVAEEASAGSVGQYI